MKKPRKARLCECVEKSVNRYFRDLNGERACGLYQMVLGEIERPLLEVVMKHAERNQSKASRMLGINRNTLRKKLEQYGLNG
ncbi:MAG: DNA-binding transcriptional regulator Fis [Gammaproteobacteria bacterium]